MSSNEPKLRVEILDGTWADAITQLRLEAYEKFANDTLSSRGLRWGPTDSWSLNLGVVAEPDVDRDAKKLLSVLRIERHRSLASLEAALQTSVAPICFPTAVLSRAATDRSAQSQDLHMLLRRFALKAMLAANYKQVYGTFKARSRRSQFLEKIGYKMTRQGAPWADFLRTDEPTELAVLDLRSEGPSAVRKLEEEILSRPETWAAQILKSDLLEPVQREIHPPRSDLLEPIQREIHPPRSDLLEPIQREIHPPRKSLLVEIVAFLKA